MANSILTVTINGLSVEEAVTTINAKIQSINNTAFECATLGAYATGVTIPAHTTSDGIRHGKATCTEPIKPAEFYKSVNKNKSTFSRWMSAFDIIISLEYFNNFVNGTYKFQYDKINLIYEKDEDGKYILKPAFRGQQFGRLLNKPLYQLEEELEKFTPQEAEETPTEEENTTDATTEETAQEAETPAEETPTEENAEAAPVPELIEKIEVVFEGITYTVKKPSYVKWLQDNNITTATVKDKKANK